MEESREDTAGWTVQPETGEKCGLGPVENLTGGQIKLTVICLNNQVSANK